MTRPRIFLTHTPAALANYYGPRAVAALREMADVVVNPTADVLDADGLIAHAAGCALVISDRATPGFARLFDGSPDLVAFLRCAVDIRNVDVATASRHGVLVTHATPGFVASVAELGMGLMIDLARDVSASVWVYRSGQTPVPRMGRQLQGSTLGLIGYGVIAKHLAKLATAFGMTIMACDPFKQIADPGVSQVSLEALLQAADFVVCLAAATDATENLMNANAFARMRRDAFFINLSRGNLVDETALMAALDEKRIAGAAMDVGRAPDQLPTPELARHLSVIATPHTGGLTPAAIEHQAFDTVAQVRAILVGCEPQGAVNLDAATRLKRLR
jgi:D-3-phosphoglycerate dehydrogenase